MASTSSSSFSTARKGSMAARLAFISLMIFWAVSWLFQNPSALILSSSSLILVWRVGTSKRVADVFHPRLEFGDEGGQIFACHGATPNKMEKCSRWEGFRV